MPYVPPHLREGYVPAAPATAEMLGINAKSQSIRPNLAPVALARVRPYRNTIYLHRKRKSYRKHRHVSKTRKRSRSRTASRR